MPTNTLNKHNVNEILCHLHKSADQFLRFTANGCVNHGILHLMRDADAILRVKTAEPYGDFLIADVIKEINFTNLLYESAISPYFES